MADKTNSTRTKPRPYRSRRGTYQFRSFQTSTSESSAVIEVGNVVQFDVNVATASARIVKSSTMANVPNVLSTAFLGIAVEADDSTVSSAAPGANAQTSKVLVCLADKDTEFLFPTKSSIAQSTIIGNRYALAYDSTLSMFYVDIANSTAGDATVICTDVPEPGTDANNPVAVKFISTNVARLISGAF